MTLSLDVVTEISRRVAKNHDSSFDVIRVAATEGGSERVELLVTISGCHEEPCVLMLNVSRAARTDLERELTIKLRDALAAHIDRQV